MTEIEYDQDFEEDFVSLSEKGDEVTPTEQGRKKEMRNDPFGGSSSKKTNS